jgi:hypothetical protein
MATSDLEALAAALRRRPNARAYVIAYAQNYVERRSVDNGDGRERTLRRLHLDPPGAARKILKTEKDYLVKTYRIAPAQIKVVDVGYRSDLSCHRRFQMRVKDWQEQSY